ncbi:MAG TPA: GIY-YIG nuclease family protein [Candidatus Synoicihabitans sp.]|nr:GIY-YIG nuclease family protein [Candidatus Synoicihabitans sp.]
MLPEVTAPDPVDCFAFVYILECPDGTFYVGQSRDLRERLRKHRLGLGSKHTQDHPVIRLVYVEGPLAPIEAVRRERQLKGWSRAKKLALIAGDIVALKRFSRSRDEGVA